MDKYEFVEEVIGTVGQILEDCEIDTLARELLDQLYSEAEQIMEE
jgi:hypothetical protein